MLPTWVAVSLIVIGVVLLAAVVRAAPSAPVIQIPTGGNTLPGAPAFGPDADPFLGLYTGAL